jgi:hypothetical protein
MKPYIGLTLTALAVGAISMGSSYAADLAAASVAATPAVKGRTIGYVLTHRKWAIYTTPGAKEECPHGVNDGEREQFKILYPDDGTQRTILDTQLKWEGETWHPSRGPEPYPFYEVEGKIGTGLNLDGKVGPNDFTSPDGEKGIDNQLYRAIGCLAGYNNSQPYMSFYEENAMRRFAFNRLLIEITDVDDLVNDDDVTVTTYRGLDGLFNDASGDNYIAGGTQHVDARWGKEFISTFKGKIKDGVLDTAPGDFRVAESIAFDSTGVYQMKDARFHLKLLPDAAQGFIGGYSDVRAWYLQLNSGWATHHQNYGQVSSPSLWRALMRLADGHPDKTGQNTTISSAMDVKFTQAYIVHPDKPVAHDTTAPRNERVSR